MLIRGTIFLPVLLACLFLNAGLYIGEANPPSVNIIGKVINGTNKGSPEGGLQVFLHKHDINAGVVVSQAVTDSKGAFIFEDVVVEDKVLFAISLTYKGAFYVEPVDLLGMEDNYTIVKVFENTSSDEILTVVNASLLVSDINVNDRVLSILEMVTLSNASDTTYIPGSGPMEILRFGLPGNSRNLIVDTGLGDAEYIRVDKGFGLMASVPPGLHEVFYTYELPYVGPTAEIIKTWRYGAGRFRVLALSGLLSIDTDMAVPTNVVEIGGRNYDVQESKGIQRSSQTSIVLNELPQPSIVALLVHKTGSIKIEYVGLAVLAVLLTTLSLTVIFRSIGHSKQ